MIVPDHLYLGIDIGTMGTKVLVVDGDGRTIGRGRASYGLQCPRPGHALQDAQDWQDGATIAVRAACHGVDPRRVRSVAVSAQGGTLVAVDEHLRPLGAARSWLDRRATAAAATFERVFGASDFYRRTGWPIAPNNTAAQLLDLATTEPAHYQRAAWFCDTAAYINGWLAGTPAIDTNVAGIAQLTNAHTQRWDPEVLDTIGVTPDRLPHLVVPGTPIGVLTDDAARTLGLRPETLVAAGAHDQYCAALGAGAIGDGDILLSTGTAWVTLAIADGPYVDPLAGIGSGRHLVAGRYGHFGEVPAGGASMEWARRLLTHGGQTPVALTDLDGILETTRPGANGLRFVPYFDGTSPFSSSETSRGALLGLGMGHDHRHVLRAVSEGVAFASRILLDRYYDSLAHDTRSVAAPIVAGGATRSAAWMDELAAILGTPLQISQEPDAACVGAAILAALAAGDVADARAGAALMSSSCRLVEPDAGAMSMYEELIVAYSRDSRTIAELDDAHDAATQEGTPR